MKQLLLFAFLFSFGFLNAQDLEFSSSDTVFVSEKIQDPDRDEFIAHSTIKNKTSTTLNVKWVLNNLSLENTWETAICDKNQCYGPAVLSNIDPNAAQPIDRPVELVRGEEGIIDVHLVPSGVDGIGFSEVCFLKAYDNSTEYGCMLYKFTIDKASSTVEKFDASVKIFPNPSADFFKIEGLDRPQSVQVFNTKGQIVQTFDAMIDGQYFIGDLPSGNYVVALLDEKGTIERTGILRKAN